MLIKILNILIVTLTLLTIYTFAQENSNSVSNTQWTRIETAGKDLSAAFPPNFIVDAEKRELGQKFKIYGFKNDVGMELSFFKDSNTKQKFQMMRPSPEFSLSSFKKDGFEIRRVFSVSGAKIYKDYVYIIKDDTYYLLSLTTDDVNREEVQRFLFSVKLKNSYLFVTPKDLKYSEKTVSIKELKTNTEVLEAFERKSGKKKGTVTKELSSITSEFKSYKDFSKPLVILDRPMPAFHQVIQNSGGEINFSLKLEVEFLADGQIGNIKILNDENKSYTDACIEAARKIKFIPAQLNAVNTDSTKIIDYSMKMVRVVSAPIIISPGQRDF